MRRIIEIILLFSILCMSVSCGREDTTEQEPVATATQANESGDLKHEIWEVTDICGEKKLLDVSNVPELYSSVTFGFFPPARHGQVYEGHYYYLRREKSSYILYQDEGKKAGSFKANSKYEVAGWAKYGDKFYVRLQNPDKIGAEELGVANLKKGTLDILGTIGIFSAEICNDSIFMHPKKDWIYTIDLQGNVIKNYKWEGDDRRYYAVDEKNLYFMENPFDWANNKYICVDLQTDEEHTIFEYTRDVLNEPRDNYRVSSEIFKNHGDVFVLDNFSDINVLYIITENEKKMKEIINFSICTMNDKYIFYTDTKSRIHRWNRKNGKDKMISSFRAGELQCTDDKLFVQEYVEWPDGDPFDPFETDAASLYVMDLDGKNMKLLCKGNSEEFW